MTSEDSYMIHIADFGSEECVGIQVSSVWRRGSEVEDSYGMFGVCRNREVSGILGARYR
jgi:hypothetical protein